MVARLQMQTPFLEWEIGLEGDDMTSLPGKTNTPTALSRKGPLKNELLEDLDDGFDEDFEEDFDDDFDEDFEEDESEQERMNKWENENSFPWES
jgi:hypothetical protein